MASLSRFDRHFDAYLLAVPLLVSGCADLKLDDALTGGANCAINTAEPARSKTEIFSESVGGLATFTVSGTARYDRYEPVTTGGVCGGAVGRLDYGSKLDLPIRRAVVQVLSGSTVLASGLTNDLGAFSISGVNAPAGTSLKVRVQARSTVTGYAPDGVGGAASEICSGASWDIRVVNNVTNCNISTTDGSLRPQYAIDSGAVIAPSGGTLDIGTLRAAIQANSSGDTRYTERAGAPFAILDTAISGLEVACQHSASHDFPLLYVNWSPLNSPTSGNRYEGAITTSFYTTEGSGSVANLYILGRDGVDTDELDRHVVAHEFGHYLENKIYRSDSIGGAHSLIDTLDPRLAFGEGFGNAFAGMVHRDPVYLDTYSSGNQCGFNINVATAPSSNDDRGVFSERSMQYLLWQLWDERNGTANDGSFDRIGTVFSNYHKSTTAFTTGLTFGAAYVIEYGSSAENFDLYWEGGTALNSPAAAVAGPFDTANDLGVAYAPNRRYRQGASGTLFPAGFWRQYRLLTSGANSDTDHMRIATGGYTGSAFFNKYGARRYYRLIASAATTTVSVSAPNCTSRDDLDLAAYFRGTRLALDIAETGATANCPSVTFATTPGETYLLEVIGYTTVSSYSMTVSP